MKTGDIVFLRRPYKGYRAVELMERLECRWLVRIVESDLELEVYEDELISVCIPFGNNRLYLSPYRRGQKSHIQKSGKGKVCRHKE